MYFSTPNFKRIMLILSPCAALTSFDLNGGSNMHGTSEDYKQVKASGKKCVVMLASDGCGHCKAASEPFENIAKKHENEAEFLKLKSSENSDIMNEHHLDGVPAFVYIDNGQVVNTELGFESEEKLEESIRNHVAPKEEVVSAEITDEVSANVEAAQPVQEIPAQEEGILAKIQALFMGLFNAIKHVFVSIFDWIKGLFNK